MSITISYGVNNSVTKSENDYPTVCAVLRDQDLRQFMGFGDNIEARVGGIGVDASYALENGDLVELVSKANEKGN